MLKHILLLIILIQNSNAAAASTSLSSLHISSSELEINREKKSSTFHGNVILCFSDITILCNKIVFYFADNKMHDIEFIEASGNIQAIKNPDIVMVAKKAEIDMKIKKLTLSENVIIEKENKIMSSPQISYYGNINSIKLKK